MKSDELEIGYERVFTVTDYYDGPRQGIANFNGAPHFYDCIFSDQEDGYSNSYRLSPISIQIFDLAMEDWAIWERWECAFYNGTATQESHPALPRDRVRHKEIKVTLDKELCTDMKNGIVCTASFAVIGDSQLPKGVIRPLQVRWGNPESETETFGCNSLRGC
jgi:hypothetical protein